MQGVTKDAAHVVREGSGLGLEEVAVKGNGINYSCWSWRDNSVRGSQIPGQVVGATVANGKYKMAAWPKLESSESGHQEDPYGL